MQGQVNKGCNVFPCDLPIPKKLYSSQVPDAKATLQSQTQKKNEA